MVILLAQKFTRFYNKLENHHHHHYDHHEGEEPLKAFRSEVSKLIDELASDLKPGSKILSLIWIKKCLGIIPLINKAFAKLSFEIDYPMSKWETDSIEEYLSFTLCLLELFNSISSSLSHLEQARLSLIHALKVLENSSSLATRNLKAIKPSCFNPKFGEELCRKSDKARVFNGKEWIFNEALKELKSFGYWVCGVFLSSLCSDVKPYMEIKKKACGFDGSLVLKLDSIITEGLMNKTIMLKEVKDVNDDVDYLVVASDETKHDAAKELERKLNKFVKLCDVVKEEVDGLFSKVMILRTELIDQLRVQR
ncbi:UPF0496 protein 4-like [Cicer arietinum]|uniref:UPF0496 protein 4-like n=1 Tax=Cicer arietinum TaxID=3827 RepID=A0A1S3DXF4_CICAR|nr:UPF0496 protein 4-like [Cicer arietinum]